MGSAIASIVDYTAQVAARVPGVRGVYGGGQGQLADPFRPGQTIAPVPESITVAMVHTSDLPDAPNVEFITQDATVEFTWTVPMRLYVNRAPLYVARTVLLPLYDAYEAAFVPERTLGGRALLAYIKSFKPQADDDWVWLAMDLEVTEIVSY